MHRKSILIGLFVVKNNSTIEQKIFRGGGRKGNCPHVIFFGGVFALAVTDGRTGFNVLSLFSFNPYCKMIRELLFYIVFYRP